MSAAEPLPAVPRRRATATSAFGVGRREAHDASGFYGRFAPPLLSDDSEVVPPLALDTLWLGDARQMDRYGEVADDSVALVVTSPPYFAGKAYEEALGVGHVPADYGAYLGMLHAVFSQCFAKLEPGGRIAVNVANLGRKPYRSLSRDVIDLLEALGYLLRGEIVWQKSRAAGGSCAWGTYQQPANPVLRDISERIVIASKGRFDRALTSDQRAAAGLPHQGTMTMDEFVDATLDVWDIPSESATRVGHPAPFPIELPRRLIELYTYRGDLVLDPFIGSGTTAVAALRTERHYAGFDTDAEYLALAERRIATERDALAGRPDGGTVHRVTARPRRTTPAAPTHRAAVAAPATAAAPVASKAAAHQADQVARGQRARELAHQALVASGFDPVERNVVLGGLGLTMDFRATDATGRLWLFDLSGAYSVTRPGLRRPEVLWRALGKAAVVHEARQRAPGRDDLGPVVLLSTDLPPARSAGAKALAAARGIAGEGLVTDVLELLDPGCMARLRSYGSGRPSDG